MKHLNVKKTLAAWQKLQPLSDKDRERLSRRFTLQWTEKINTDEAKRGCVWKSVEFIGIFLWKSVYL